MPATTMNVSVKWQHDGHFRRFSFDAADKADAYRVLLAKVHELVPDFDGLLAWKDAEGDLIVMCTDAEVREAVRESADMLLRLHTVNNKEKLQRPTVPLAPPPPPQQEPAANKTTTDAEAQVRPRCLLSPDERLERTQQRYLQQLLNAEIRRKAQMGEIVNEEEAKARKETLDGSQLHENVTCDGCDVGGIRGTRYKCLVCADYDLCGQCERDGKHPQHNKLCIADPEDKSWMPLFWRQRNRWAKQQHHAQHGQQHWRAHYGHGGAGSQRKRHSDAYVNAMHYLHHMGKSVAEALTPFGIDVDVEVEHEGQREKLSKTEQPEQPTDSTTKTTSSTSSSSSSSATTTTTDADGVTTTKTTHVVDGGDPITTEVVTNSNTTAAAAATPEAMDETTIVSPSEGQLEWTVLSKPNQLSEEKDDSPVVEPSAPPPLYPQVQAQQEFDAKYNQVIEQLLVMGFNDDGGWLKSLVAAKKGDINEVLNALNPRHN